MSACNGLLHDLVRASRHAALQHRVVQGLQAASNSACTRMWFIWGVCCAMFTMYAVAEAGSRLQQPCACNVHVW
jgi:hypothetical protein